MEKTPVESPARELVPQPHGGALRTGGNPGNRGGGRLPSHVRLLAQRGLRESLPEIRAIAMGTKAGTRPADQVQAWRAMASVALGNTISSTELQTRLIQQVQATRDWARLHGISQDLLERLFDAQESAWR